ncbi:glycoside hydrolase family 25 protein [Amycolatopsis sp. FDAARGOS 1241]|nr:glycoside hydrolase family 25 protein [Amycolatopsis sp. FDAARGOS 1241]
MYRKFQTVTSWPAVKRAGVTFVYVKLSDGGSTPGGGRGDAEVAGARSVGIPVGGYHFVQANPGPAAQADILLGEVRRLDATGCVPMLDLEDNPAGSGLPNIPDSQKAAFGKAFCNRVAAQGFRPGVYLNNALAKLLRPDNWGVPGLVIWIARYGANPDAAAGRYDIHQYSSSGSIPGITAAGLDLDESYTAAHLGARATTPVTEEDEDMSSDSGEATAAGQWGKLHIPVNGGRYLRLASSYDQPITIDGISLVGDTPGKAGRDVTTVQAGGKVDADRPGPWDLAGASADYANKSHVVVRYQCAGPVKGWVNNRG